MRAPFVSRLEVYISISKSKRFGQTWLLLSFWRDKSFRLLSSIYQFFLEEIYISIDVISHNKLGTKARLTCREKKKSDPKKGFIPSLFFWARETNSVESYFWQCLNCSSFFSFFLKGLIVLYSPKLWGQSQCSYEIIKLSVSLWLIGICILPYLSLINSFNFNISNWISNLFKIHAPTILYSYIIEQFQFCP